MKNILKNTNFQLLIIIILAFIVRIWNVSDVPPSLNWDEVSHGYNAYSILKTGKDEWGEFMPTIFRAYGDYKLPVYIYLTVPSIAIFGLNELGVRFPSILAGTLTVLFTYLLAKEIFRDNKYKIQIAALAMVFVTIEPWTFFVSRAALEANLALFFIVAATYYFFKSIKTASYLIPSTLFFGLSAWTYNSARIFVPIILLVLVILYKKELLLNFRRDKGKSVVSYFVLGILILPMLFQLGNPVGQARYGKVAIIDEGAISQINEQRRISNLPEPVKRLRYNKATYFGARFFKNVISHYKWDYLYEKGGTHYQFSLQNHGLLYKVNVGFLCLGVILLLISGKRNNYLLLTWVLVGTFASSLTREAPHVLRSITMLPIPMIITAYGVTHFYFFIKSKIPLVNSYKWVFIVIYIVSVWIPAEEYLLKYFNNYSRDYSWAWQYGYKEAISYINNNYYKYDKIIFTKKYGEPHEFLLFYSKWNPESYRNDLNLNRFTQSNWWWVDGFDKYIFINEWQMREMIESNMFVTESKKIIDCTSIRCLVISSKENSPQTWKKLTEVKFVDGGIAFEIYEN